ncbi:N-6 DNA methylase, partial [Spirochaetota bacterium]
NWNILADGDIVGYIYQQLQHRSSKKKKGQYFTPGDIVNYLVKKTLNSQTNIGKLKIMDPACGSGQFLIEAFRALSELYEQNNINPKDAAQQIIKTNIFGADLDQNAVSIAKFNMSRISGCKPDDVNIYNLDFLHKDECNLFSHINKNETFDLIIGNPPWCSKFTKKEKTYFDDNYESVKSGINTFSLFIERSYDFISKNGTIAFLIPEAYLNIKAHRDSRVFVLNKSVIKDIAMWGERFNGVYAPSISIIIKDESNNNIRSKNIVKIIQDTKHNLNRAILIPQAYYHKTFENIFNTHYSRKAVDLISTIENHDCQYLKDRSRFFLGIVTGNNTKFILNKKSKSYPDPIIVGKDISQYKIDFSNHYFKYNQQVLQQVAPKNLYKSGRKIIYKFIGKKLTFALDNSGYYTLNNVNCFLPEFNNINIETTLALLNSKVMQYYYEKSFFTVKVLKGNLERLPLKVINKANQKKLKKLAQMIINTPKLQIDNCRENIEDIIFHEYGINDRDAYKIND